MKISFCEFANKPENYEIIQCKSRFLCYLVKGLSACLAVLFFLMYKLSILIFLVNVLPDVYICPFRKKSARPLPEGTVKRTHLVAYQIQGGY